MANLCLLPDQVNNFRKALKDKEINISDLLNMSSEARTEMLSKYAGHNAKAVNTLFEEKLVLKNRMLGIKNWASKVGEVGKYSPLGKEKLAQTLSEYRAAQQERIFSPAEHQAFLNDLADKQIGTHISKEQANKIFELSKQVQATKESTNLSGVSNEHLQARQALNNYTASINAPSVGKSIAQNLAVIGRNNLLMNPATPIKAVTGQVVNSVMEAVGRRLSALSMGGANPELVKQANQEAWNTYLKTGQNTAVMESLDDTHMLGKGENFNTPALGDVSKASKVAGAVDKVVSKVAKVSNKIVIDWAHNVAFTKFYQKTFFDHANIVSTSLAKNEGLKGTELKTRAADIFKDAARVQPETREGAIVRQQAQLQSARITSTNETFASRLALGAKNMLNKINPNFPLGDLVIPIAKIPASIIANGIDNAGAGIPKGVHDIFKGRQKMQSEDPEVKNEGSAQFADGVQHLMRIAGVLGTAALIASQFKKEDFRQDPKTGENFVRIGNVWINMEYISAISPALAGFMTVKQKGGTGMNAAGQYAAGALSSLKKVPGIDEGNKLVTSITNSDYTKGIKKYATDFFTSRGVPTFIKNIRNDRPIERLFFGATGVQTDQQYQQGLANQKAATVAKAKAARLANPKPIHRTPTRTRRK